MINQKQIVELEKIVSSKIINMRDLSCEIVSLLHKEEFQTIISKKFSPERIDDLSVLTFCGVIIEDIRTKKGFSAQEFQNLLISINEFITKYKNSSVIEEMFKRESLQKETKTLSIEPVVYLNGKLLTTVSLSTEEDLVRYQYDGKQIKLLILSITEPIDNHSEIVINWYKNGIKVTSEIFHMEFNQNFKIKICPETLLSLPNIWFKPVSRVSFNLPVEFSKVARMWAKF